MKEVGSTVSQWAATSSKMWELINFQVETRVVVSQRRYIYGGMGAPQKNQVPGRVARGKANKQPKGLSR